MSPGHLSRLLLLVGDADHYLPQQYLLRERQTALERWTHCFPKRLETKSAYRLVWNEMYPLPVQML
jgi:hypothetical protein